MLKHYKGFLPCIHELYTLVQQQHHLSPVVIDADDLLSDQLLVFQGEHACSHGHRYTISYVAWQCYWIYTKDRI